MTDVRVPTKCNGCGATDDHPKHHYGDLSFHHDHTPDFVIEDMTHVSDWVWDESTKSKILLRRDPIPDDALHPATQHFLRVRAAAQAGTHGDELAAEIRKLSTRHKPDEDTRGAQKFEAAVAKIKREQHDARPAHLQHAAQFEE